MTFIIHQFSRYSLVQLHNIQAVMNVGLLYDYSLFLMIFFSEASTAFGCHGMRYFGLCSCSLLTSFAYVHNILHDCSGREIKLPMSSCNRSQIKIWRWWSSLNIPQPLSKLLYGQFGKTVEKFLKSTCFTYFVKLEKKGDFCLIRSL